MHHITTIPQELLAIFGPTASDKFVDFLNSSLSFLREDVIAVSAGQFENKLVNEISGVRLEIAEIRTEIAEVRAEIADLRSEVRVEIAEMRTEFAGLRSEFSELRSETRTEIAGLRSEMKADFAGVHKEIAGLHREISSQTKWIVAGFAAMLTLYPIISRLLIRLIP